MPRRAFALALALLPPSLLTAGPASADPLTVHVNPPHLAGSGDPLEDPVGYASDVVEYFDSEGCVWVYYPTEDLGVVDVKHCIENEPRAPWDEPLQDSADG